MCKVVQCSRLFFKKFINNIFYKPKCTTTPVISLPLSLAKANTSASIAEYMDDAKIKLSPCTICGRTFNQTALSRHTPICQRLKRKANESPVSKAKPPIKIKTAIVSSGNASRTANSLSQCLSNQHKTASELCPHCGLNPYDLHVSLCKAKPVDPSNSELSIQSIVHKPKQLKPPTSSVASLPAKRTSAPKRNSRALEKCPYCERTFCQTAFERHVNSCKTKNDGPIFLFSSRSTEDDRIARQRMQARINYKPPNPKKR